MRIELEAIGRVRGGRREVADDYWGGSEVEIVLRDDLPEQALDGVETFSHVEVLYYFDRVDPAKVEVGARRPRNNPNWPAIGIFAQRGKNRPNRIGSTICRVVSRDGRVLRVAELDAVEGTPVLDIKPVLREFLPRGAVEQPEWASELMRAYWEPARD